MSHVRKPTKEVWDRKWRSSAEMTEEIFRNIVISSNFVGLLQNSLEWILTFSNIRWIFQYQPVITSTWRNRHMPKLKCYLEKISGRYNGFEFDENLFTPSFRERNTFLKLTIKNIYSFWIIYQWYVSIVMRDVYSIWLYYTEDDYHSLSYLWWIWML